MWIKLWSEILITIRTNGIYKNWNTLCNLLFSEIVLVFYKLSGVLLIVKFQSYRLLNNINLLSCVYLNRFANVKPKDRKENHENLISFKIWLDYHQAHSKHNSMRAHQFVQAISTKSDSIIGYYRKIIGPTN